MDREIRSYVSEGLEVRKEGDKPRIVGYAAVFDQLSEPMMGFRERVRPGAFAQTLKDKDDIRALWNHDSAAVLGRMGAGTLSLREDKKGLLVEIDPPDTQVGRDAMESIRRGDVSQMSFAFAVRKQQWTAEGEGEEEQLTRDLIDVRLFEVSPVTFPAYPQTAVAVRTWTGLDSIHAAGLLSKIQGTSEEEGLRQYLRQIGAPDTAGLGLEPHPTGAADLEAKRAWILRELRRLGTILRGVRHGN